MASSVKGKTLADFPEVLAQWHPTKNGDVDPTELVAGSNKKFWWKCPEGSDHEWHTPCYSRTNGGGCPACSGRQLSVTNSLASLYPDVAAEWHPTKNGDVTPADVIAGSGKKFWWKCAEGPDHEWSSTSGSRTHLGNGCPACRGLQASITNNLTSLFPELAAQWHPTKNGDVTPADVVAGSANKFWWKCAEGPDHQWFEAPYRRKAIGGGCPACSNVTNSLASLHPELAAQWHPTKNGDLTPADVTARSSKQYWWKCSKGPDHEWKAACGYRSQRGGGCLACAGRQASVTNSLASLYPDVAAQWHPTKNGELTPADVTAGSGKKCWWKCAEGSDHEWPSTCSNRTHNGTGCPACAGKQASVTNSLASLYPDVAAQWHPTKNGDLTPADVTAGSSKKFWWKCAEAPDHEWLAAPNNRMRGNGCSACRGLQASITNSLASLSPDIAGQWHPTKNGDVTPADVVAGSHKKFWWKCPEGSDHEWLAQCAPRVSRGIGCPACHGLQLSVTNSLASLSPDIAGQWHPTKNGDVTPADVVAGSKKKFWWKCSESSDHEWKAASGERMFGYGCPACTGKQASVTNSLASLHPELAAQWHPTKNGVLTPADVVAGSNKKFWWKCPEGSDHDWQAVCYSRTTGRGCPICNTGWTVESVRVFVKSLLQHIGALNPAELHVLFQQSGLLDSTGKSRNFLNSLVTGRFPEEELQKFVDGEPSLVDEFTSGEVDDLSDWEEEPDLVDQPVEGIEELASEEFDSVDEEAALPVIQTKDALSLLDFHVIASSDDEAVAFLLASAREKLWRHAYLEPEAAVEQAKAFKGDKYAEQVRKTFLGEYKAATALKIPKGYDFRPHGELAQPNLMQRLVAVRVRDNKRYGNWSGTGAGKTLSAVLATRVVSAKLTVICCPNAVVEGWSRELTAIFPNSVVRSKTWEPAWPARSAGPRYLVQNFEQFQQPDSEGRLKGFCDREAVEFIIIDEIHYAKQRHADQMSRRKRLVNGMVAAESAENPNLFVLGMSATPVINNLTEGKSLVEMVTGLTYDDLETKATVANCMRLFQRLVTLGTRWLPNYSPQLIRNRVEVDCSEHIEEIRALGKRHSPLDLEKILTQARLPTILEHCERGKKTLIYTLYVDEIDRMLFDAVTEKGLKAGLYTGDDKSGLPGFLAGDVDVLIGSSSIGTGVDGLQHVCNKLIINVLPWTNAEYQQLVGRVYRQGQRSDTVEVVIPTTHAVVNGERWSYCESKLKRIQYKRSIADAAVDGAVPEGNLRSPAQAQRDIMAWLERLDSGEIAEVVRTRIVVPLADADPADAKRRNRKYGDFSKMNARWNSSKSGTLEARLQKNVEEWQQYHTLYREARKTWKVVPFEEMIRWAEQREGLVIGDFGCGEALFGKAVLDRHVVHSFDHQAIDDTVTAGDISNTTLEDECLDVALFSLSLMGSNFADYLKEAWRTLKIDGSLHIWEATSRFDDPSRFGRELSQLGFKAFEPEERGPFTYIEARKTARAPAEEVRIRFKKRPKATLKRAQASE